jgi:hypothetical protein
MVNFRRLKTTAGAAAAKTERAELRTTIGFKPGDEQMLALLDRESREFRAIGRKAIAALLKESLKYGDFQAEFGTFTFASPMKGKSPTSVCATVTFGNFERQATTVRHFSKAMKKDYSTMAVSPLMGAGLHESLDAIGLRNAQAMADLVTFLADGSETVCFTARDEQLSLRDGETSARVFRAEVMHMRATTKCDAEGGQ